MSETNYDMKYIKSRFNIIINGNDNEFILYNTRTSSICVMDSITSEFYNKFNNNLDLEYFGEIYKSMTDQGFFVRSHEWELEVLRHNLNLSKYSKKNLTLTIAPTMKCNLSCSYCFESNKSFGPMNEETIHSLVKFVSKKLNAEMKLRITWFGGEPLLEINIMKKITKMLVEICAKKNCIYEASIVTNGSLISNSTLADLKELFISDVQITLDGSRELHNKKRFLSNGIGTYDILLKSIENLKSTGFNVTVRLNLDKNNVNTIKEVHEDLNGLNSGRILLKLARIEPIGSDEIDKNCLYVNEIAQSELDYFNIISNPNINIPKRINNYCSADQILGYVIDSAGYIYKCWSDIGKVDNSIGHLDDNSLCNESRYLNFIGFDATYDEECSNCNVLPLCMGGCPNNRIKGIKTCSNLKYNICDIIKLAVVHY